MLVPERILANFEVYSIDEKRDWWLIDLREKADLIPEALIEFNDVVLDGFTNKIEVQSNSLGSMKPVYLHCYRRRWKRSNQKDHYSNSYELHEPGVKMVQELGDFFKKNRRASGKH